MIQILSILLLAAIAGVIAYSVIRQGRRPAEYGFSFKRGGVASLALLAVIHVYLVISGRFVLSPIGSDPTPLQPSTGVPDVFHQQKLHRAKLRQGRATKPRARISVSRCLRKGPT